jgi:Xaa-Pro aminopeptidase
MTPIRWGTVRLSTAVTTMKMTITRATTVTTTTTTTTMMVMMEYPLRLNKLRAQFAVQNIDALLVTQPDNRRYLSGFAGTAGTLLITPLTARLYTDFRYTERAQTEAPDYEIHQIAGDLNTALAEAIKELKLERLGFEANDVTYHASVNLREAVSGAGAELVATVGLADELRQVKEPSEIVLIESAVSITLAALRHARDLTRPGITELALAWEIENFLRENGSQELPFPVIVASGPNAAQPHATPTERSIGRDESVIIDIGAKVGGYTADMTRTFYTGAPAGKFREVYDLVARAQAAAYAALLPGVTAGEVDDAAREVIRQAGYGPAFGHALGHGIGLATHELPRLAARVDTVLTDGMVFTLEPGVYIPGWGGVRIEDDAVLEGGTARTFSYLGEI